MLHGAGMLKAPLDSGSLEHWGKKKKGKWITVYANSGHTYAMVAGLRWDTSGGPGPRWHKDKASRAGFKVTALQGLLGPNGADQTAGSPPAPTKSVSAGGSRSGPRDHRAGDGVTAVPMVENPHIWWVSCQRGRAAPQAPSASSTDTYSQPTPSATPWWVTLPAATLTPGRSPGSRAIASLTPLSASERT